jgi:hypothetical protein
MEACSSAHHWGRQLLALGFEVKLIAPAHVKPYVRRNKNDAADAAAICEAAGRPGQRFVAVRSIDNEAALMRHRARELLAGQRTGGAQRPARPSGRDRRRRAARRVSHAYGLKRLAADGFDENGEIVVSDCARVALRPLVGQIDALDETIGAIDKELAAAVKAIETAKRTAAQVAGVPFLGIDKMAKPKHATVVRLTSQSTSMVPYVTYGTTSTGELFMTKNHAGQPTRKATQYINCLIYTSSVRPPRVRTHQRAVTETTLNRSQGLVDPARCSAKFDIIENKTG